MKPNQTFPGTNNPVSPNHYKVGGLEVMKVLKAKLTPEQFIGFCLGNVLKYTMRAQYKNGLEDYKKARVYLNEIIKCEETCEDKK